MSGKNLVQKLKTGILSFAIVSSSYFNSVQAQENYQPKYNTISHKMLMIEAGNFYLDFKKLDDLIDDSKNYIKKKENYSKEEIAKISEKIYSEIGKKLDLNGLLELYYLFKDAGPCYKTTLCYLAIAKANDLPIYAVDIPKYMGHIFVRYDKDGKHDPLNPNNPVNNGDINIETTTGGISEISNGKFSDSYYINKHEISKEALKKQTSLRALKNEEQYLSVAYIQKTGKSFKEINRIEKEIKKEIEKCSEGTKHPFYGYRILPTKNEKEECLKNGKIKNYEELLEKEYEKILKNCDKSFELDSNFVGSYLVKEDIYRKRAIWWDIKSGEYPLLTKTHSDCTDKANEYYRKHDEYRKKAKELLGIEEDKP